MYLQCLFRLMYSAGSDVPPSAGSDTSVLALTFFFCFFFFLRLAGGLTSGCVSGSEETEEGHGVGSCWTGASSESFKSFSPEHKSEAMIVCYCDWLLAHTARYVGRGRRVDQRVGVGAEVAEKRSRSFPPTPSWISKRVSRGPGLGPLWCGFGGWLLIKLDGRSLKS
jgi:hypothetical protein